MKRLLSALLSLALLFAGAAFSQAEGPLDWVIFVYLTGTDLETEGGAATSDLLEMVEGSAGPTMRFVVQTGGTREWAAPDLIPSDRIARFEVFANDIFPAGEWPLQNMGEAGTLRDFVAWGFDNYQAEKYGLVIWDHGSGSINGVAFDELFDNDSLSLREIGDALAGHEGAFEFIGFDACLMATVETAQAVMPFARYMVASEELEPGSGWDYEVIGRFLAENPQAGGAELGRAIADGFLASNIRADDEAITTLSVTDLGKLPALAAALDLAGWQMYRAMASGGSQLKAIVRGIHRAENYGGNTPEEGYTNMVDVGSMMLGIRDAVPEAGQVLLALHEAVVYKVAGSARRGSHGLSVYYPLQVQGSQEYQVFRDASPSEGYRRFVAGMMYGAQQGGTAGLSAQESALEAQDQVLEEAIAGLPAQSAYGFVTDPQSQLEVLDVYMDGDGTYTLALDPGSMDSLLNATFTLLMDAGGGEMIELGEDDEVVVDEENALIQDSFEGWWTALPDGQLLSVYLLEQHDAYNLYSAPVRLNGRETNLRILYDWDAEAFRVIGGWDGLGESGASSKEIVKVSPGDILVPLYDAYDAATGDYLGVREGGEYIAQDGFTVDYVQLPAADYYYSFTLTDLYGLNTYTDFTVFTVDEAGDIWFEE